jgi:hypothetical protein
VINAFTLPAHIFDKKHTFRFGQISQRSSDQLIVFDLGKVPFDIIVKINHIDAQKFRSES